jgi:uncharacterized protein with HEPN domain
MKDKISKVILEDIIEFCSKIERYTRGLKKDVFENKEMVIDAVLRNLELMGEASNRLSDDFKQKYSKIPWKKIIGLRNIVIHAYSNVDLDIIWDIITKSIPETKKAIQQIYKDEFEQKTS